MTLRTPPGVKDEREVEEEQLPRSVYIEDRGRERGSGRLEFSSIGVKVNEPQITSNTHLVSMWSSNHVMGSSNLVNEMNSGRPIWRWDGLVVF